MPTKEQQNRYYKNWVENNPNARESIRGQNQRAYRRRKKEWFQFLAEVKSGPCIDCGQTFHPAAMQFDHVNGEKEYTISAMMHKSKESVLKELEKCVLRCANCHLIRHCAASYDEVA